MYFCNVSYCDDVLSDLLEIPPKSDICIIDIAESERMWPIDFDNKPDRRLFYNIHNNLKNHQGEIYYIGVDCNVFERYNRWFNNFDFKKKINVFVSPFNDLPKVGLKKDFYFSNRVSSSEQKDFENYISNCDVNTNFSCLVCGPKLIRLLFLDEYYKHKNFNYSFSPWHHEIKDTNLYVKKPYVWCEHEQSLHVQDIGFNYFKTTDKIVHISKKFPLKNGLNSEENQRELTEFLSSWQSKTLDKEYFNNYLPKETFQSCCDIVLETYTCSDSIFFSEITWKEVIFKRPFIILGSKHQNNFLKKLGFKLYDEIFNYDFDGQSTIKKRFESFCNEINRHIDMDPSEFKEKTNELNEKIEFNYALYNKYISDHSELSEFIEIVRTGEINLTEINDRNKFNSILKKLKLIKNNIYENKNY